MARAFTLIELLVVITIIVVLLALLTPAMDRAVYQAEMAVDAANMRGIATAVGVYAAEYKRFYPLREYTDNRSFNLGGTFTGGKPLDTRPRLMPYMDVNKTLQDPFIMNPADISVAASPPSSHTYSSYWLWFGWRLADKHRGMKKLGDAMIWVDPAGISYRFDTLVSDGQAIFVAESWTQASHPDYEGRLTNTPVQNQLHTWGVATYSLWTGSTAPRITVDSNFMHVDGSATRMDELVYDSATQRHDERLVPVPERINDGDINVDNYLPRPGE